MNRHLSLIVALAALAALAAGCVKLGSKPLDKHYYQLSATRQAAPEITASMPTLKVRRLETSDMYSGREIIYRSDNGRVQSDFYNLFFIAPGSMLTQELREWLRMSGRFEHIVSPGSLAMPGLTLEGLVNELYGDYTEGRTDAVVKMQFHVVDEASGHNEIVFSASYDERIPTTSASTEALVSAMSTGVTRIFEQLETDLAAAGLEE